MTEPMRVLIVEDEALLAMELESLVEEAGHEVVGIAATSTEARRLVDTVSADIAFVDVHLADGPHGVDVASYIAETKATMVVFLTANPKRLPDHFANAVGVIAKPYTIYGVMSALKYLEEGVHRPPPRSSLPVGFTLSPRYAAEWGAG